MKSNIHFLFLAFALLTQLVFADKVILNDGSVLDGKLTLIDEGVIYFETPDVGKTKLKQEAIASFQTDSPLNFRLEDESIVTGTVAAKSKGVLDIRGTDTIVKTNINSITTGWAIDKPDPVAERNRRKWTNNLGLNLNGRTGNVERFNFSTKLDFRLTGPIDEVYLGFEHEKGEENGNETQDRTVGQASYDRFNKDKLGWFVRTRLEHDGINNIDLRSATSNGIAYRWIKNDIQTLVTRSGIGFRYTEFQGSSVDNESTATLELGLSHTYKCSEWMYIENELNYSPATEDFGNYNTIHDSSLKMSMGNSKDLWIRFGIRNEYQSLTSADENLDTNYYTQLIYSWK